MKSLKFSVIIFLTFIHLTNIHAQTTTSLSAFMESNGYTAIQLGKFPSGHLYLQLKINDSAATFILDTGAGGTVLEEKRETKFKLKTLLSKEKGAGAGGTNLALKTATIENFSIGKFNSPNLQVHLMSLAHVNNAFKQMGQQEVDGVIGADILTNGKAVIDYINLVLYLKN